MKSGHRHTLSSHPHLSSSCKCHYKPGAVDYRKINKAPPHPQTVRDKMVDLPRVIGVCMLS